MKKRGRQTLRGRMVRIYTIAILIPLLAIGGLYLLNMQSEMKRTSRNDFRGEVMEAQQELDTMFHAYEMLAGIVVGDQQTANSLQGRYDRLIDAWDSYAMLWRQEQNFLQNWPGLRNVTIYVENNSMISTPPYVVRMDEYMKETDAYRMVLAMKASGYWSGVREVNGNQEYWRPTSPSIGKGIERSFSYNRVFNSANHQYADKNLVTIEIYESVLLDIIENMGGHTTVSVFSPDGETVVSAGESDIDLWAEYAIQYTLEPSGFFEDWEVSDGLGAVAILSNGWILAAQRPNSSIYANFYQVMKGSLAFISLSVCISFLLISVFSSRLYRRTLHLSEKIEKINCDLNADIGEPMGGNDEIAILDEQFSKMAESLQRTVKEQYALKLQQTKYQLSALQTQIQPHFLYNALSTVSWLIDSRENEKARAAVENLSRFYQVNLSNGKDIIRLQDELDCLRAYMDIQRLRYAGRVRLFNMIDSMYDDIPVPKLALQTLAENSIQHGMAGEKESITLLLSVREEENTICIVLQDDGVGISPDQLERIRCGKPLSSKGGGVGIANIHQRIQASFGPECGVSLSNAETGGTVVEIRLPRQYAESDGP